MNDNETTIAQLRQCVADFIAERDWKQYHRPKNLAMSMAIETAELMEHFQWLDHDEVDEHLQRPEVRQEVSEEMADVLSYLLSLANATNIDLAAAMEDKMKKNAEKYPADIVRGHYKMPEDK